MYSLHNAAFRNEVPLITRGVEIQFGELHEIEIDGVINRLCRSLQLHTY